MSLTCDQTPSADSIESVTVSGVKEITRSSASDGSVEECDETVSTQTKPVAENGDIESYGPEDAPSANDPVTGRPHAQTFLDKMQSLAFHDTDPGYDDHKIIYSY